MIELSQDYQPGGSPFPPDGGPRRAPAEIAAWARETYGITLVAGFDQLRDAPGAITNETRVASFMEFGRNTALTAVEIIRGRSPSTTGDHGEPGQVVYRHPCEDGQTTASLTWHDPAGESPTGTYYYVRATQRDDEMAWSSPHWIDEP